MKEIERNNPVGIIFNPGKWFIIFHLKPATSFIQYHNNVQMIQKKRRKIWEEKTKSDLNRINVLR